MSEATAPRHILHLVVEGFSTEQEAELRAQAAAAASLASIEIFRLTEANATEALEKIFDADSIAVWGRL